MINSGQVPGHLIAAARTGFLRASKDITPLWQRVAKQIDIVGATEDLIDLGAPPMPKNSKNGATVQGMSERWLRVAPVDWDITIGISDNAINDDRAGELEDKAKMARENFDKHVNQLVFTAINLGESIGAYGACYDDKALFASTHVDKAAKYQTAQSNTNALALSSTNFKSVYASASLYLDDQGEQTGYIPDLLIVNPAYFYDGSQITANTQMYGTSNRDLNPYSGRVEMITVPWVDSTAWFLADTKESTKPLLVVMREAPYLQSVWFDAQQADGGMHYFKFFARYNVQYGDWRLITQGNT